DPTHPDLAGKLLGGYNFVDGNTDTADVHGHGTAVAGTAAAIGDNGLGVASPCWGCPILPVRIADASGGATYSNIASGITWAADHGARVANISFGPLDNSQTVIDAARYFQDQGGLVVIAEGNSG